MEFAFLLPTVSAVREGERRVFGMVSDGFGWFLKVWEGSGWFRPEKASKSV